MTPDVGEHKFNDDLLLSESDRKSAQERFPGVFHVLDHPELRSLFQRYDLPAQVDKTRSRNLGLLAIGMLALALLVTSSAPLWAEHDTAWTRAIEIGSAVLGVGGIAIGWWGVLRAKRKRNWLCRRVMTERLRQFHFQTFVRRLDCIAASVVLPGPATKSAYLDRRRGWLLSFEQEHEGKLDSVFSALTNEASEARLWLHPSSRVSEPDLDNLQRAGVFDAYRALRIEHQIQYADYQLRKGGPAPLDAVRNQKHLFNELWLAAIFGILALHLVALFTALFDSPIAMDLLNGPVVHVASLCLLIVAVTVRTIEGGLATGRDIERYETYRTALLSIRERFDEAPAPRERLVLMEEMERLVFNEMLAFLRAHDEALFCL